MGDDGQNGVGALARHPVLNQQHRGGVVGIDPDDPATMLLIQDGVARQRSDAVLAIVAQLPSPYRWAIMGRVAPRFIRDRLYDFVARRRRRFPGATWCALPPAGVDLKDRVLG